MAQSPAVIDVHATIEDLTFLADTHCSLEEAAQRLGFNSANTLDKWLRRNRQSRLLARFVRPADQPAPPRTTRPPAPTALSVELRRGARPFPPVPRMSAPHRPWCVDCKIKHEAVDLDTDGRCTRCARAAISRAEAARRRAQLEIERRAAEKAEREAQPRATSSGRTPGRTPGSGTAAHREKNPPATRETRPVVAGGPRTGRGPDNGPRGPRATTDTARIRRLYVDELRTIPEISRITGHVPSTIRRVLLQSRIELRDDRRTRSGSKPLEDGPELTEAVRHAYLDEALTLIQTAARFHISQRRVKRILDKAGIQIRPHAFSAGYQRKDQAAPLKERIDELGVSTRQIKEWAVRAQLLDDIRVGLPSATIVEAYAAAQAGNLDLVSFAMGAPTSVVRIWAAKNGHRAPTRGPVPRELRMAYAKAMFALSQTVASP